jgi:hypothetical protein
MLAKPGSGTPVVLLSKKKRPRTATALISARFFRS